MPIPEITTSDIRKYRTLRMCRNQPLIQPDMPTEEVHVVQETLVEPMVGVVVGGQEFSHIVHSGDRITFSDTYEIVEPKPLPTSIQTDDWEARDHFHRTPMETFWDGVFGTVSRMFSLIGVRW